jgi:hypothetical protein
VDVWEYFQQRDREVAEQSAAWDDDLGAPYSEEQGSNGQRGRIFGRVVLSDRAFLAVNEEVEVLKGSCVTRRAYAYFLVYDGVELCGEERDPTHTPAVHRHDRNHNRYPSSVISFNEALTRAWAALAAEEELRTYATGVWEPERTELEG